MKKENRKEEENQMMKKLKIYIYEKKYKKFASSGVCQNLLRQRLRRRWRLCCSAAIASLLDTVTH